MSVERSLRTVYQNYKSSFEELLEKDESFTVHERNIQTLCIELYKVAWGICPQIMRMVFPTKLNISYPWENIFQTCNIRTVTWGSESVSHLGPKIWSLMPISLKKYPFCINLKKQFDYGNRTCVLVEYVNFILRVWALYQLQIDRA